MKHVLRVGKRYFKPTDLGPRCPVCGTRMTLRLADAGIGIHPACPRPGESA